MKRFWNFNIFSGLSPAIILLVFQSFSVAAQDPNSFQIEKVQGNGLYNDHVACLNQDKFGFIWAGTYEGLYRYDGYSFKAFRNFPGDTTTLVNNVVNCIYSAYGDLWVGTFSGFSRIDPASQSIINFKTPGSTAVRCVLQKNNSVLWVGTYIGVYEFNIKTHKWKPFTHIKTSIASICRYNKSLYIATKKGFLVYNLLTNTSKFYSPVLPVYPATRKQHELGIIKAMVSSDGNYWLATWGNGLVSFDPHTEKIRTYFDKVSDPQAKLDSVVSGLAEDGSGNIWVADREAGVVVFDPKKNKLADYPVQRRSETELSGAARSIFRDRSGIIWIGSENGVFKYDPHRTILAKNNFLQKIPGGLQELQYPALVISQKQRGQWWLGTYDGLFLYDGHSAILKDENKQMQVPPNCGVFNIVPGLNGTTWFTARYLLIRLRKKNGTGKPEVETYRSKDIQTTITALYIDKEKRIWIGTHGNGIYRFDTAKKIFIPYPYFYHETGPKGNINPINAFCEVSKDSILVGGEYSGLFLMNTNNGGYRRIHWQDGMDNNSMATSIFAIVKIAKNIWIGTENAGLWQTDSILKTRKVIALKDGLPSMSINSMVADKNGNLWLLTYAGIVKMRLKDKKIIVFDKKDGIESLDEMEAIDTDSDGTVSVSDRGYIYHFNPAGNQKNTVPPAVFLTGFKVFDTEHEFQKDSVVNLNYDQNYFSFNYVALNYTQSNLNKYAYKMQGLDENWTDANDRRYASYANLPEGRYVFMVKASNNEGIWSTKPARLVLIINPPFWHRWWFYLLCVGAILGVLYALYAYKINELKMRLQLRDRIATDFHDELGSTLSSIALYSEMAMIDDFADKQRTKNILTQIGDSSRLMVLAMQDMIWAIQPKNDKMQEVIYRIREYAYPLAELKKIDIKLLIDEGVQDIVLSMDARKNIYLVFKEALNNAFKYASAKNITVTMARQDNILSLTIQDDGIGFDDTTVKKGNGLANMQKRAKLAGGKLYIRSGPEKGTTIIFNCPIN